DIPHKHGRPFVRQVRPHSRTSARVPFALAEPPAAYRPPVLARGTLNFSSGSPDVRLVPLRTIGRAHRRVVSLRGADLLGYGEPEGHPALRSALAAMLANTRGLSVTADDLLITRGSQMGLSLVSRALLRPGDVVVVEELGYRPAWEAFRAAGATVVPVRIDRDGIDVDSVRALVERTTLRAI